jgi:integrase
MARKTLTDKGVQALKAKPKLYAHPDPQCPGHYIRVSPTGSKSFVAVTRDMNRKQKWITIGSSAHFTIEEARAKAREIIKNVRGGLAPEGPESFEAVANDWFQRHVIGRGVITSKPIRSYINRMMLPLWSGREFKSIGRGDITKMLDAAEDNHGPVAADRALAVLSSICTWYASRNDSYNSPIVRGMKRTSMKERARTRILSDEEIKTVWNACEGNFGDLVKLLLLTGQRRDKVASMKWEHISQDGMWSVKNGDPREKGAGGDLQLPPMALAIVKARPIMGNSPYVFPGRSSAYFVGYGRGKKMLDKATGDLPGGPWRVHDLRRTARSLLSRAGIKYEVAERVLGHVQPGVAETYNRHAYATEKAHALKALADLIESIVNGNHDKVVKLRG